MKTVKTTTIEQMDFEGVEAFHDALCFAFYPDGIGDEEELDNRFLALWNIFLASVGWDEGEFWDEYHARNHLHCKDCGHLIDDEGNRIDEDGKVIADDKDIPPQSKPN